MPPFVKKITIDIAENPGDVRICDAAGNVLPSHNARQFADEWDQRNEVRKGDDSIAITWSNPCQWIYWRGQWYWVC
jgi:hypothetical protein